MLALLRDPLARFRLVALLEGLSFLVLLFIAMPLKYLAGMPLGVRVVGMAHGLLFVLYLGLLLEVALVRRWTAARVAAALLASLLPFGTFAFEALLRREERAARATPR